MNKNWWCDNIKHLCTSGSAFQPASWWLRSWHPRAANLVNASPSCFRSDLSTCFCSPSSGSLSWCPCHRLCDCIHRLLVAISRAMLFAISVLSTAYQYYWDSLLICPVIAYFVAISLPDYLCWLSQIIPYLHYLLLSIYATLSALISFFSPSTSFTILSISLLNVISFHYFCSAMIYYLLQLYLLRFFAILLHSNSYSAC